MERTSETDIEVPSLGGLDKQQLHHQAEEVISLCRQRQDLKGFPVMLALTVGGLGVCLSTSHPQYQGTLVLGGMLCSGLAFLWARKISRPFAEDTQFEIEYDLARGGQGLKEEIVSIASENPELLEVVREVTHLL